MIAINRNEISSKVNSNGINESTLEMKNGLPMIYRGSGMSEEYVERVNDMAERGIHITLNQKLDFENENDKEIIKFINDFKSDFDAVYHVYDVDWDKVEKQTPIEITIYENDKTIKIPCYYLNNNFEYIQFANHVIKKSDIKFGSKSNYEFKLLTYCKDYNE